MPPRAHAHAAVAGVACVRRPRCLPPLLARFTAEWQALAGHVHAAASVDAVADVIADVCRTRGTTRVLGWTESEIGVDGLAGALAGRGISIDHGSIPREPAARAARLQALAEYSVGVTGADALLAESGSVVVTSGPGRPRLASLLPPVHITVARPRRLYLSLEHLLAAEPALGSAGSNFVAISGPSRTADIEMTLTRGVHGPGEVHVIIVEGISGQPSEPSALSPRPSAVSLQPAAQAPHHPRLFRPPIGSSNEHEPIDRRARARPPTRSALVTVTDCQAMASGPMRNAEGSDSSSTSLSVAVSASGSRTTIAAATSRFMKPCMRPDGLSGS